MGDFDLVVNCQKIKQNIQADTIREPESLLGILVKIIPARSISRKSILNESGLFGRTFFEWVGDV